MPVNRPMDDRLPTELRHFALRGLLAAGVAAVLAHWDWVPGWLIALALFTGWVVAAGRPQRRTRFSPAPNPGDPAWGALLLVIGSVLAWEAARGIAAFQPTAAGWLLLAWSWSLLAASGPCLLRGFRLLPPTSLARALRTLRLRP